MQETAKVQRLLVYSAQESRRWSSINTRQILTQLQWLFVLGPFGCRHSSDRWRLDGSLSIYSPLSGPSCCPKCGSDCSSWVHLHTRLIVTHVHPLLRSQSVIPQGGPAVIFFTFQAKLLRISHLEHQCFRFGNFKLHLMSSRCLFFCLPQ